MNVSVVTAVAGSPLRPCLIVIDASLGIDCTPEPIDFQLDRPVASRSHPFRAVCRSRRQADGVAGSLHGEWSFRLCSSLLAPFLLAYSESGIHSFRRLAASGKTQYCKLTYAYRRLNCGRGTARRSSLIESLVQLI